MEGFREEKNKLEMSNTSLQHRVDQLRHEKAVAERDGERQNLIRQLECLEMEVHALTEAQQKLETVAANAVEVILAEAETLKKQTFEHTDNIYILEGYLQTVLGGDKAAMEMLRRDCYGAYFVDEEDGLPDVDAL